MRRAYVFLLGASIFTLAGWVRMSRTTDVFFRGEVIPVEDDSYYHLFRILHTAQNFPRAPLHDAYLDWPNGAIAPWPAGFDQLGALLILASGTVDDLQIAAGVAALLPVVIGLLLIAGTILMTRRLLPAGDPDRTATGLVAGLMLASLPQAIAASQIGWINHHSGEPLCTLLLFAWVLERARWIGDARSERTSKRARYFEAFGFAAAAASIHLFAGSVLYVAVAVLMLAALSAFDDGDPRASLIGSGAPGLALAALALFGLNYPHVALTGKSFDYFHPSFWEPSLLLIGAAILAMAPLARRAIVRPEVRAVLLVAATLAFLAIVRAVTREEDWQAKVAAHQPLFLDKDILWSGAWIRIWEYYGWAGLAAPLLLPAGVIFVWRLDPVRGACFGIFTAIFTFLTLFESRYGRVLVIFLAISTALVIDAITRRAAQKMRVARGTLSLLAAGVLLAIDPQLQASLLPAETEAIPVNSVAQAAITLRDHARPVERGKASGVIAPWEVAFAMRQLGGRPVMVTGFGPELAPASFAELERAWLGDEANMLALMERRDSGYLVVGPQAGLPKREPGGTTAFVLNKRRRAVPNERFFSAYPLSPLLIGGTGSPGWKIPHLSHFMPIFASEQTYSAPGISLPRLWIYEAVKGARLVGSIGASGQAPGAETRVLARLSLKVNGERDEWIAWIDTNQERFELILPVPSGMVTDTIVTSPRWRLMIGQRATRELEISEADVREGRTIELTSLFE